ncbi:unnamed protein product [Pedinophyceae sp. YPF-701]|nr:unnamed protein product [Pedinophyceae sp. YPF-701]
MAPHAGEGSGERSDPDDEDELLIDVPDADSDPEGNTSQSRWCSGCTRSHRACVCAHIPSNLESRLRGKIIILQHPHEESRNICTGRLLAKCVPVTILRSRTCPSGKFPDLDAALDDARDGRAPLYVMYPGPGVQDLANLPRPADPPLDPAQPPDAAKHPSYAYYLFLIDATWHQAKEMWRHARERLLAHGQQCIVRGGAAASGFAMPDGEGNGETPLPGPAPFLLMMEPQEGMMTTMECVARALGCLEGPDVMDAILRPLGAMVEIQARYDPAVRCRTGR